MEDEGWRTGRFSRRAHAAISFGTCAFSIVSMEQSQWTILRQTIRQVTRSMPKLPRVQYGDCLIACLYFWTVLHDRPMTWVVDRSNYNRSFRPRKIPSISQLNRRIAPARFQRILQRVHQQLAGDSRFKALVIDGQALCVGPVSQDRDARLGHTPRRHGALVQTARDRLQ